MQGEGKPETDIPLHPHLGFQQRKAIFGIKASENATSPPKSCTQPATDCTVELLHSPIKLDEA